MPKTVKQGRLALKPKRLDKKKIVAEDRIGGKIWEIDTFDEGEKEFRIVFNTEKGPKTGHEQHE